MELSNLLMISAIELRKINQNISGYSKQDEIQKERQKKYQDSQKRIKNWKDTPSNQRALRLKQKEHEELSLSKKRNDEYKEQLNETKAKKEEVIRATKAKQFMEKDHIKEFHSKLILWNTLEEREMQIKLKQEREKGRYEEDKVYLNYQNEKDESDLAQETEDQKTKLLRRVQLAKYHIQQIQEKKEREDHIKDAISPIIEDNHVLSENLAHEKVKQRAAFKRELDSLCAQKKQFKAWDEMVNTLEDEKNRLWREKKERQTKKITEIEANHKREALVRRETVNSQLHSTLKNESLEYKQILDKQQQDFEKKQEEAVKKEKEKKQTLFNDLKKSHQQHLMLKQLKKDEEKRENEQMLQESKRKDLESKINEQAEKERRKKEERDLKEFNFMQANEAKKMKQSQMKSINEENEQYLENLRQERREFNDYVIKLENESWAVKNPRIFNYIKTHTNTQNQIYGFIDKACESHSRLGFQGHSYSQRDLAGNNDIVRPFQIE